MSNTPRTDAAWKEVEDSAAYPGDAEPLHKLAADLESEFGRAKASLATLAGVVMERDALLEALQEFLGCMELSGQWEDGCFYYNGMAAPEFQDVIFKAQAVIRTHAKFNAIVERAKVEADRRTSKIDAGFDEWIARELPRATGYEIDLCRTVWLAASKQDSAAAAQSASAKDSARLDFLAEVTKLSVLRDSGAMLKGEEAAMIARTMDALYKRFEFHRRFRVPEEAFRLAVDDAMVGKEEA